MNLNLFDGSMIVQNILEKAVKRMYLVVSIVKKINYMERNSQILNKTIMVIVFVTSRGQKTKSSVSVSLIWVLSSLNRDH